MVIQILPRDTRNAELAESFGSVGEGLGGALGLLIGSKISQVRARQAFKDFGIDEQQADALSRLPMRQRTQMIQDVSERTGYQPQQQPYQMQQQAPMPQQQPYQMQPQTMQNLGALQALQIGQQRMQQRIGTPMQGAQQGMQGLDNYQNALAAGNPQAQLQAAQGGFQALQKAQLAGLLGNPQQQVQQPQQAQRPVGQAPSLTATGGMAPQLPSEVPMIQPRAPMAQIPAAPLNPLAGSSPKLRAAQTREDREQRKLEIAEQKLAHTISKDERKFEHDKEKESNQQTKEYYDQLIHRHKGDQETKIRLNKMDKLIDEGKLPTAAAYRFFKSLENVSAEKGAAVGAAAGLYLGGPAGAIGGGLLGTLIKPLASAARAVQASTNENLELFDKVSADFVKSAKQYFGNRLTDTDLEAYMATVPSLLLTDKGKKAVIENLRDSINLQDLEYNAAKYIIKQNNGKRPADLALQVQNMIDPQIDRIANNLKASINQKI